MKCEGSVPEIITNSLLDELDKHKKERIEGVGYAKSQEYYEDINIELNKILNSGLVLFNDPITDYVKKVGEKLVRSDKSLDDLQFFTMRSNVVNAFVTQQGVVFVTQGLIAQLENEAQLAYILAHEISHYKLEHNITKYKESIRVMNEGGSYSRRIKALSKYSKEKEYAADSMGIAVYNKAGYNLQDLYNVFDVLSYSYLPFDLVDLPLDYFNTEMYEIPEQFFTDEFPRISFEEDYDDSKSSHPNIASRREKLETWVDDYSKWGDVVYNVSEDEFKEVRDIARFESLRNDLLRVKPVDVLYSAFLLEEKYPDNRYIQVSRAKAWSQLISLREGGKFYKQITKPSKVQGPPHQMFQLIRGTFRPALYTMALRNIYDIKSQFPEDEELKKIYKFAIQELAKADKFKPDDYKDLTLAEGLERFQTVKDSIHLADSLAALNEGEDEEDEEEEKMSKYDKIRSQNNPETAAIVQDSFDLDEYYLFGLSDVIDSAFMETYNSLEKEVEEQEEYEDWISNMRRSEKKKREKEFEKYGMRREIDDIVLLSPEVAMYKRNGDEKVKQSLSASEYLEEKLAQTNRGASVNYTTLSSENHGLSNAEYLNDQSFAMNSVRQITFFDDINLFPVEYDQLTEFREKYNTTNLGIFLIEGTKQPVLTFSMVYTMYIPPLFVYQLGTRLLKRNEVEYTFALFDISSDYFDIEAVQTKILNGSKSKLNMYHVLQYYLNELPKSYEK
ncbi:MAG: M48 family metallopeptidase [Bacteroidota bacterium]